MMIEKAQKQDKTGKVQKSEKGVKQNETGAADGHMVIQSNSINIPNKVSVKEQLTRLMDSE